jgi:hypothetical protein
MKLIRRALALVAELRERVSYGYWLRTAYVPIGGGAITTGAVGTGGVASGQLLIDVQKLVMELEPDAAPLLQFSKAVKKDSVHNSDFDWYEDDSLPRFDRVNNGAGYTNVATSIVVDNGDRFQADRLAYVSRTGEVMRIVSVATNTLTVVRGIGGGNAALVDNDELIVLGSAFQEGTDPPPAVNQPPTKLTNYCEIFKTTVDETETLRHTDTVTDPHEWDRQRGKKGLEHVKDIEYSVLLGRPSKDTSGTHPRRTTGGAYYYVTQNQTDAGGALTEAELFSSMRTMFRRGSKRKLALGSPLVGDVINGFPRSKLMISQSEKVFGMQIMKVVSQHGTINFVTHWLLEGDKLGNEMLYLDLDQIAYCYLQNKNGSRDTHVNEKVQPRGRDSRQDEWLSECGLRFGLPATHGKLTNVTS